MNHQEHEKILARKLTNVLSNEFNVYQENQVIQSPGKFLLDGVTHKAIPDLLLSPKKHLLDSVNFIETIIPIEIKVINNLDVDKFENLMFQCHTYRFSNFNNIQPKLCLYYIDDHFEPRKEHCKYDYELSKNQRTIDFQMKMKLKYKSRIETLFGRFGIAEILIDNDDYMFRIKRQCLFEKRNGQIKFNSKFLNFWWGTSRNSKALN